MLINFTDKLDQKNDRIEQEFKEVLSRYKDHDIIIRIDNIDFELKEIPQDLYEFVCNYAKNTYEKILSKSIPDSIA
jgi:hypothetical protein